MSPPRPHAFDARWELPPRPASREPVFVLGAGWRCGSTLLQRLVASSSEVLVWGEPYGRAGLIEGLAASSRAVSERWPTAAHFPPERVFRELSAHWIANLFPPPLALREAHAAFLDRLLAQPARERGFERFGLKEVRLGADEARYLEWIYPDARFCFLVRNPWDAWASARGGSWWQRWPDRSVRDAHAFADLWRRLARGFLDWPRENGRLVRYEDVTRPDFELGTLAEHCRLERIDPAVRQHVVRGMARPPVEAPDAEADLLREVTAEVAAALGYAGPGDTRDANASAPAGVAPPGPLG